MNWIAVLTIINFILLLLLMTTKYWRRLRFEIRRDYLAIEWWDTEWSGTTLWSWEAES